MTRPQKGFTMIELLIVISVLGILAIGLLAAVDPFEQLKKARDTNTRQSALALQTSFVRYYATHGALPWDVAGTCMTTYPGSTDLTKRPGGTGVDGGTGSSVTVIDGVGVKCITNGPEADGELKAGFVAALASAANSMYVNSPSTSSVSVCFAPQSKSIRAEESTKYNNLGVDTTGLGAVGDPCSVLWKAANPTLFTTCFYCAK